MEHILGWLFSFILPFFILDLSALSAYIEFTFP